MSPKPFELNVRAYPGLVIFDLCGELNVTAEGAMLAAYNQAIAQPAAVILFNFNQTSFITSAGMALIVSLLRQTIEANRRLISCGLNDHYLEVFKITRITDFMQIFPDEASALAQLKQEQNHLQ